MSGKKFNFVSSLLFWGLLIVLNKQTLAIDCLIPKGVAQASRALLLQQCLSKNQGEGNETKCYPELGCFPMDEPWVNLLRPLPSPYSPKEVNVSLTLYTRNHSDGYNVTLWPKISLKGSDYDPQREATVFITHGFASNGHSKWLIDMKNVYLKNVDANVFLVNWEKGAALINYLQAASNTRITGAELARFGRYLIKNGLNPKSVHAIGHSLGAQISAYFAKNFTGENQLGRLTALDPAQPGFEGSPEKVRLSSKDAIHVDAIHTNARPFIPFLGFGMIMPVGHIDYYMNGGAIQPGCISPAIPEDIKSIEDLAKIPVETIDKWVSCSHGRSYEFFTESLQFKNCTFWGRPMTVTENILKIATLGLTSIGDPVIESVTNCTTQECSPMGLNSFTLPARGTFAISTDADFPYCTTPVSVTQKLGSLIPAAVRKSTIFTKLKSLKP